MELRLGKKPAAPRKTDLLFASYRKPEIHIDVPHSFGHFDLISEWGMLGNDKFGDCALAGPAHETMMWNAAQGKTVEFNEGCVLADYSAVTGFQAGDPSTDQGSDVHDVLSYREHTGIGDAQGGRHLIGAYVAIELGNFHQLAEAAYLFGVVGIGIEFPASAMDQFNAGKPWTVVKGASIEGGHYVPVVGVKGRYIEVVTWGKVQRMSHAFFDRYCDEAWAMLSPEYLASGKSPEGFDLQQLTDNLAALRAA